MSRIELTISFTDDSGAIRQERHSVESTYHADLAGEHRVAHILLSELKVSVGEQVEPKHNATASRWLEFPNRPAGLEQYFDIRNSQALWFELASLVMGAEGDLILAQAYKVLEPLQEPSFSDDTAINNLYYVHDRKLTLLNQSVHAQDLVNRLLHESLGGDLVDTCKLDWERVQLTRANVAKGLMDKLAQKVLSQANFDAINQALDIPKTTPRALTSRTYRNQLMHHIRPSVDYSMFFSAIESRAGEDITNAAGNVIGRRHILRARPPVQYLFKDLYAANSEYLDAIVAMLQKLSQLDILRR
jgi:hypothetical protein